MRAGIPSLNSRSGFSPAMAVFFILTLTLTFPALAGAAGCPGDFFSDLDVDGSDLAILAEELHAGCLDDCLADLDNSGAVDAADLHLFSCHGPAWTGLEIRLRIKASH